MTHTPQNSHAGVAYGRNLFIGAAGWSRPSWNDLVYPARRPKNFSGLALLSGLFNVVEIDSTYYHPQSTGAAQQWLKQVESNPGFRFTARIWQKLVLEKAVVSGTGFSQTDIALAKRGMLPLLEAGRLGALLAPFPQSFHSFGFMAVISSNGLIKMPASTSVMITSTLLMSLAASWCPYNMRCGKPKALT